MAVFFVVFFLIGIMYIHSGKILWGSLVEIIALIYVFGFEPSRGEHWHSAAHILTGGIFSITISGFLILWKLASLLSSPEKFSQEDFLLFIASFVAFIFSLKFVREFEA